MVRKILWPILAILATAAIYLLLVLAAYKILVSTRAGEKLLWKYFAQENIVEIGGLSAWSNNEHARKMQVIIDNLPINLLPEAYPKIKIMIKRDDYVNAYAAPEGRIILTTGLLNNIKSENALLFVIAHEIAHLSRQDHLYEFSRSLVSLGFGFITRSDLFAEILMLIDTPKSKDVEFIADSQALEIILYHYGHVGGIDEVFELLQEQDKNRPLKYTLATHPDTALRHHKIKELVASRFLPRKDVVVINQ